MNFSRILRNSLKTTFSLGLINLVYAQGEAPTDTAPPTEDSAESSEPNLADYSPLNVILIMTDDQGWGDFGVHGNKIIETPNLDAMAARSVSWENFYVSPVCSPTRASLMTGRYNQRTKCVDTYLGRSMMASDEVTIAEALQGAGYATGIFGKWHLGDNYPMRPSDQGFEYSLIHKGGGLAQPSEPINNNSRYTDPILFLNNAEIPTKGYCTDIYFNEAIKFITKSAKHERPFFAYIATNAPHAPFHDVPTDLLEKYKAKDLAAILPKDASAKQLEEMACVAAMITNVDQNVGKLFKSLEEQKLIENTLIIYLNDNGPNRLRFTGEFKGRKTNIHEGGVRSPLWIHLPSKLKAGSKVFSNNAAHIDIMPTIMDACDMGTPEAFAFDGRSLMPKMLKPETELAQRPIFIQAHRGATPIRYHNFMVRDGKWKLSHDSGFSNTRLEERKPFQLFDLSKDPSESADLAKTNPEEVKRLTDLYNKWFDDVSSTRIRDKGTPYILIDRKHENPVVLTWQERISQGWGLKDHGFWKVFFQRKVFVDVLVNSTPKSYKKDITGYTPVLQIGNKEYKLDPVGKQKLAIFQAISVPKGKTTIQAKFVSPDQSEEVPAYQLRLMHR